MAVQIGRRRLSVRLGMVKVFGSWAEIGSTCFRDGYVEWKGKRKKGKCQGMMRAILGCRTRIDSIETRGAQLNQSVAYKKPCLVFT